MDGIVIESVINVRMVGDVDPWIYGTGWHNNNPFGWDAFATPQGWLVEITGLTGKRGQLQGATFNMLLEVAIAARRIL
jgi:hypothetical protein